MSAAPQGMPDVGVVVIGRNEAARLQSTLPAAQRQVEHAPQPRVLYVDSGSTDRSVEVAQELGVEVLELDPSKPFSASRGRNEGAVWFSQGAEPPDFLQFVDGDSELEPGWVAAAAEHMAAHPRIGVLVGRTREVHPKASIYHRLAELDWGNGNHSNPPPGGNAMLRRQVLTEVGGYDERLAAGEDPDLIHRIKAAGWEVTFLDRWMTWHDVDMHRFGQWWRRCVRTGEAYALVQAKFSRTAHPKWERQVARAWIWSLVPPFLAALVTPWVGWWALLTLGIYPLQVLRMAVKCVQQGMGRGDAILLASATVLGRFAEFQGILRARPRRRELLQREDAADLQVTTP